MVTPPTKPIRVLHVLPDLDMSGGQQLLRRMIAGMDPAIEHDVVYYEPNHEMRELFEQDGARVHYIPSGGRLPLRKTLPQTIRLVRRRAIDVIHINGTPIDKVNGQLAALLCRRPVVSTLHGPRLLPTGWRWRLRLALRQFFERWLDPWTTSHVVAVSDAVLATWQPYLESRGIPASRMRVNPNGVPAAMFEPSQHAAAVETLRSDLGLADRGPLLISVGRLDENKAQHYLIQIMQRVQERWPKAALLLIGEGSSEASLRQQAAELGLSEHIFFLGRRQDIPALMAMSDAFVFSSLNEGLPLSVLEAMAAALPVVTFALPGLTGLVEDGVTGYSVKNPDAEALGDRILALLENAKEREALGSSGRARILARHDIAHSIRELERVYREAAGA